MDPISCLTLATVGASSSGSGGTLLLSKRPVALQRRLFLEAVAGVVETSFSLSLTDLDKRKQWIQCIAQIDTLQLKLIESCNEDFVKSLLALASCVKDPESDSALIAFLDRDVALGVLHSSIQKLRKQDTPPDLVGWIAIRNLAWHSPVFTRLPGSDSSVNAPLLDDITALIHLEMCTLLDTHNGVWRSHMRSIAALRLPLTCLLDILDAFRSLSVGGEEYFKASDSGANIAHSLVRLCIKLEPLVADDRRLFGRQAKGGGARDSDDSERSDSDGNDDEVGEDEVRVAPGSYTPFADKCLVSASRLVVHLLHLQPSHAVNAAPSDCLAWIKSPCWQVQHLCLTVIKTRLVVESPPNEAASTRSGKLASASAARADKVSQHLKAGNEAKESSSKSNSNSSNRAKGVEVSSKQRSASRLPGKAQAGAIYSRTKTFDEVCRSGFLRPLLWCLLHSRYAVRETALGVLEAMTVGAAALPDSGAELWAALLEQGLVALLEVVGCGLSVDTGVCTHVQGSDLLTFPEPRLSLKARNILDYIAIQVGADSSLRSRAVSALVHTGSPRLRANIFSGISFLAARLPQLGALLWSSGVQGGGGVGGGGGGVSLVGNIGGEVFQRLVDSVYKDPSEISSILAFMHHALQLSARKQVALAASSASTAAAPVPKASPAERSLFLRGGPTVTVLNDGHLVKMLCAAPAAVSAHSRSFAAFLQTVMDDQREGVRVALGRADIVGYEDIDADMLARTIAAMPASDFIELRGCSYDVWQEIFSHIVDDFLMEQSLSRMDIGAVVEAFAIARKFDMRRLGDRYASILGKRIVADNFADVLEAAIGIRSENIAAAVSPGRPAVGLGTSGAAAAPHLTLCCDCLSYLSRNLEKVLAKRYPARIGRVAELLHALIGALFFPLEDWT